MFPLNSVVPLSIRDLSDSGNLLVIEVWAWEGIDAVSIECIDSESDPRHILRSFWILWLDVSLWPEKLMNSFFLSIQKHFSYLYFYIEFLMHSRGKIISDEEEIEWNLQLHIIPKRVFGQYKRRNDNPKHSFFFQTDIE